MESWEGNLGGGIKFQVHPKHVIPNIEKYGLAVGAGMQANVNIQKNTVTHSLNYIESASLWILYEQL